LVKGLYELAHSKCVVAAHVSPSDLNVPDCPVKLVQLGLELVDGKFIRKEFHYSPASLVTGLILECLPKEHHCTEKR
jgi:hypothetical protein